MLPRGILLVRVNLQNAISASVDASQVLRSLLEQWLQNS